MTLAQAALLFCVQLAFGSLVTFALNDRRAIGPKYFKLAGWVVVALLLLAGTLVWPLALDDAALSARTRALCWTLAAAAAATLLFSSVAGWGAPRLETACLAIALLAGGATVVLAGIHAGPAVDARGLVLLLVVLSGLLSALVVGFVTWGMILGHWYLVASDLDIRHLRDIVRPLPWLFAAKAAVSLIALWLLWERFLGPGVTSTSELLARSPERVMDVVNLWARIPVGLLIPAVMAWMTLVTVRMRKTQPATGILYAMCGLVYLGEFLGTMVEAGTGVPL